MLPAKIEKELRDMIQGAEYPKEKAVDVMYVLQGHYGFMSDEAMEEGARLLGMTTLELEGLATFYDYIYRQRVGRYVIRVCDSVVCWMNQEVDLLRLLCDKLDVEPGKTTADGMFTVLPTVCIGYCDHAPAMLVNGRMIGPVHPGNVDEMLEELRNRPEEPHPLAR